MPKIRFEGHSAEHTISNITIDGVYMNGERITDASVVDANEFTSDIRFK